VTELKTHLDEFRFRIDGTQQDQAMLLCQLIAAGVEVVFFGDAKENLEDVFLAITEGVGG